MSQPVPGHNKVTASLVGILFLLFVSPVTLGLVIMMNKSIPLPEQKDSGPAIEFAVKKPKPKKKKKPKEVKKRTPPKSKARQMTPPPDLGVSFEGVDFGLPEFSFGGVAAITDGMIGDMDNLVMTEDTVDSKPVIRYKPPLNYPPRARQQNIEGYVTLWFVVAADGSTKNIKVKESNPPEIFDDSAMTFIRNSRFEAAKYKGRPVEMSVTMPINFGLN